MTACAWRQAFCMQPRAIGAPPLAGNRRPGAPPERAVHSAPAARKRAIRSTLRGCHFGSGRPRRARLGATATRRPARRRICTPVPFEGTLSEEDALRDFQLRVAGFDAYALYTPGAARARAAVRAGRVAAFLRAMHPGTFYRTLLE